MKLYPVYQAIENRENPDEIEKNGPVKGIHNPWLGTGYYFWDGFIENAHWWGKHHVRSEDYMICQACIDVCEENYLDLYGNTNDIKWFSKTIEEIKRNLNIQSITVSQAISFLKRVSVRFNEYTVIRAETPHCGNNLPSNSLNYVEYNKSQLELCRMIQVCVYKKEIIHEYKIVYPSMYVAE